MPVVHPGVCAHCGLPLGPRRRRAVDAASDAARYCCLGCGFAAHVAGRGGDEGQARWILARLMLAGFLAMNVMLLSLMLYSVDVYALEVTSRMQAVLYAGCRWIMLGCSFGVGLLLGVPLGRYALGARRVTADLFILVGVVAAWGLSLHHTLKGAGPVYFDTAAMLLVLLTLGRLLEARGRATSGAALTDLLTGVPERARRVTVGGDDLVPLAAVGVGDRLVLRAGEYVPVDSVIETGGADVDESSLTGEAVPVAKREGDVLYAGTLNRTGHLVVRATAVGAERVLARLTRLLEGARTERAPVQRMADRIAAVLLPTTLALALGVVAYWVWHGQTAVGLWRGLAVLVIACPCAFGVATPLALWIALSEAAGRGILVRAASVIETLGRVDAVVFDKTGTLTTGKLEDCVIHPAPGCDADSVLAAAAAVAPGSDHPIARALAREAVHRNLDLGPCTHFEQQPGRGMRGVVGTPGRVVAVGTRAWLEAEGVPVAWDEDPAQVAVDTWVAIDGRICGALTAGDTVRADAADALAVLRARGLFVALVTGDRADRATALAQDHGLALHAGARPEEKLAFVRALQAQGRCVAMVGDGVNDAAALAGADVGIAMACGADLTRDAADVCLVHDRLAEVAWLIPYARQARRRVRGNLVWALAYNALGLPLAVTGTLTPVSAAAAMVGSSVLVLANSLRLRGPGGREARAQPSAGCPAPPSPIATGLRESVPA